MKINFSPSVGSPPIESVTEIVATLADEQQRRAISQKQQRRAQCLHIVAAKGTADPRVQQKPADC